SAGRDGRDISLVLTIRNLRTRRPPGRLLLLPWDGKASRSDGGDARLQASGGRPIESPRGHGNRVPAATFRLAHVPSFRCRPPNPRIGFSRSIHDRAINATSSG